MIIQSHSLSLWLSVCLSVCLSVWLCVCVCLCLSVSVPLSLPLSVEVREWCVCVGGGGGGGRAASFGEWRPSNKSVCIIIQRPFCVLRHGLGRPLLYATGYTQSNNVCLRLEKAARCTAHLTAEPLVCVAVVLHCTGEPISPFSKSKASLQGRRSLVWRKKKSDYKTLWYQAHAHCLWLWPCS